MPQLIPFFFVSFFILAIFLDYFIVNNYLNFINKNIYIKFRNMFYPIINIILFFIFLFIYYFIFNIELDLDKIYDVILNVTDDKNNTINVGTGDTVNVNNPNIKTSFSKEGINSLAAAISYTGGATLGFKVAQYVGGPPIVKVVAGLGTMVVVQSTITVMSHILNKNSGNKGIGKLKFIYFSVNSENNDIDNLSDYPLNLLFNVNNLLYGALLFLYIILNIYISRYILNINYDKFIPKNKFGKILNFIINRYLKI